MAQLRPIDCILIGRRTALPGGVTPGEPQADLGDQLVDPLLDPFICVHSGMRLAEAAGPNCIETPNSDGTVLVMNLGPALRVAAPIRDSRRVQILGYRDNRTTDWDRPSKTSTPPA
jgi:hypothetical protein